MGREFKRKLAVEMLVRTLEKVKEKGLVLDEEKLINLMGAKEGISRRTAKEYINNAKALLDEDDSS